MIFINDGYIETIENSQLIMIKVKNIEIGEDKTIKKYNLGEEVTEELKCPFECICEFMPQEEYFEITTPRDISIKDCYVTEYINRRLKGFCKVKRI
jgi:hypothetical protein